MTKGSLCLGSGVRLSGTWDPTPGPRSCLQAPDPEHLPAAHPKLRQIANFSINKHVLFNLHRLRCAAERAKPNLNLLSAALEHAKLKRKP
jgi:hypothetical protein